MVRWAANMEKRLPGTFSDSSYVVPIEREKWIPPGDYVTRIRKLPGVEKEVACSRVPHRRDGKSTVQKEALQPKLHPSAYYTDHSYRTSNLTLCRRLWCFYPKTAPRTLLRVWVEMFRSLSIAYDVSSTAIVPWEHCSSMSNYDIRHFLGGGGVFVK